MNRPRRSAANPCDKLPRSDPRYQRYRWQPIAVPAALKWFEGRSLTHPAGGDFSLQCPLVGASLPSTCVRRTAVLDPLRKLAVHRSMHEIGLIAWRAPRSLRACRDRATLLRLDAVNLTTLVPFAVSAMSASQRAIPRVNHSDAWQRQLSRMASSRTVVLGLEDSCRWVCWPKVLGIVINDVAADFD
jgi:hypothetical protein